MNINGKVSPVVLVLVGAVLLGLILVLISWVAPVLTPILVACFMAALAAPFYSWLLKKGVKSSLALILLIVALVAAVLAIAGLLWLSASRLLEGISYYQSAIEEGESAIGDLLAMLGITEATLTDMFTGEKLATVLVAVVGAIAGFVGDLLFGLVLVAFLLVDSKRLVNLATNMLSDRPFFGKLPEIAGTVVTYFGIRTRLNMLTGLGFGLMLLVLGVDYAILWGVLAFVLSYVPYIGLFTAMIAPVILAYAESGLVTAVIVVVGVILINTAIESIVEPRFTGKTLKLSPAVVMVSFFVWGWLLGPTGALLSMPITVTLMLVTGEDEHTKWISKIIGTEEK